MTNTRTDNMSLNLPQSLKLFQYSYTILIEWKTHSIDVTHRNIGRYLEDRYKHTVVLNGTSEYLWKHWHQIIATYWQKF